MRAAGHRCKEARPRLSVLGLPLQQGFGQGGNICLCSYEPCPSSSENHGLDDNKMAAEGGVRIWNKKRAGGKFGHEGDNEMTVWHHVGSCGFVS